MKLRVATYNIHKGVSAFGRTARIHELKQAIHLLDADLVFLQEVQGQHDFHAKKHADWPTQGQHTFLASQAHEVAYGMNAVYEHGHHGNALLSRFPISYINNHDVSDHAYEQRGILHAIVDVHGLAVHCFVIHLGLFAASRRRQIQALIKEIKTSLDADAPLIIAGDFNDWNQRLSPILYQELGVREAFDIDGHQAVKGFFTAKLRTLFQNRKQHARSFPARLPCLCLDRMYTRGMQVESALVMSGAPWSHLSDHVPLTAILDFPHHA